MFGSENLKVVTFSIDSDPGGADEMFYLMKTPREITIKGVQVVSEQTQNAGTAILARLENWGTLGTGVQTAGTVSTYLGGTAVASRLTARTPAAAVIDTTADNIAKDSWLVLHYTEEGTGWIAGDRLHMTVQYVDGLGA